MQADLPPASAHIARVRATLPTEPCVAVSCAPSPEPHAWRQPCEIQRLHAHSHQHGTITATISLLMLHAGQCCQRTVADWCPQSWGRGLCGEGLATMTVLVAAIMGQLATSL